MFPIILLGYYFAYLLLYVDIVTLLKDIFVIITGYSEWMGRIMKKLYEAKLALLKIELQVIEEFHCGY